MLGWEYSLARLLFILLEHSIFLNASSTMKGYRSEIIEVLNNKQSIWLKKIYCDTWYHTWLVCGHDLEEMVPRGHLEVQIRLRISLALKRWQNKLPSRNLIQALAFLSSIQWCWTFRGIVSNISHQEFKFTRAGISLVFVITNEIMWWIFF